MSRTIENTPFMWEKGGRDKFCPGPESCLPRARPVLGASVSGGFLMFSTCSRQTATGALGLLLLCLEARHESLSVACN